MKDILNGTGVGFLALGLGLVANAIAGITAGISTGVGVFLVIGTFWFSIKTQ